MNNNLKIINKGVVGVLAAGIAVLLQSAPVQAAPKIHDYIVVGLGTAGGTLAYSLANQQRLNTATNTCVYKNDIMAFEAGYHYDPLTYPVTVDPGAINFNGTALGTLNKWPYSFVWPSVRLFGPSPTPGSFTAGKSWGGSGMHNNMISVYPTKYVLDTWDAVSGSTNWDPSVINPLIQNFETFTNNTGSTTNADRGNSGPISVVEYNSAPDSLASNDFGVSLAAKSFFGEGNTLTDYNDHGSLGNDTLGVFSLQRFQRLQGSSDPLYSVACNVPDLGNNPNGAPVLSGCPQIDGLDRYIRSGYSDHDLIEPIVNITGGISTYDQQATGIGGRNLTIKSGSFVTRVLFDKNKTANGVEYYTIDAGAAPSTVSHMIAGPFQAYAKTIILSAGALNTPQILERSGIGDATRLKSLGIPVVVNNPNVGEHLQNHINTNAIVMHLPFARTTALPTASLQGYSDAGLGTGARFSQMGPTVTMGTTETRWSFAALLLNPNTRGYVHITNANAFNTDGSLRAPSIAQAAFNNSSLNANYPDQTDTATVGTDAYNLVHFYRQVMAFADSLNVGCVTNCYTTTINNVAVSDSSTDQTLYNLGVTNPSFQAHAVGTTRMGQSTVDSVVDGNLRVMGVSHLIVDDIGAAPLINDGNTNAIAIVLGLGEANILGAFTPCQ